MKKLILVFGIIVALPAVSICQNIKIGEIYRIWTPKNVLVKDGMTFKYTLHDKLDTAYRYLTGIDTFQVTVTFNKVGTAPKPIVTKIDSEAATYSSSPAWSYHGAAAANTPGWFANTIAYSNAPGSYVTQTFEGRQIKIYAETKPSHGTGVITIMRGAQLVKSANVNFVSLATTLPALIYDSGDLGMDTYTWKLTVTKDYCLYDFSEITR